MRPGHLLLPCALALGSCAWSEGSNWHLMDEGYSISATDPGRFLFEVHLNQLKQLGGDVNSPRFHLFVAERLKRADLCPAGWTPLPCVNEGSCIQRTERSVTVPGRCEPS
jgi:hypothetical protein